MFGFPDINTFQMRQVLTAVSWERTAAVANLTGRLLELKYYAAAIAIAEHEWVRTAWRDESLGHDPADFVKLIAWGPVAKVSWDDLTPIDRPTFTDRWLRTVGCGMAYGPRLGQLDRQRVDPVHFMIHDDLLAMFDSDCEIRHNYMEEFEGGFDGHVPSTGATFETSFVLRDAKLTGVFVFSEED